MNQPCHGARHAGPHTASTQTNSALPQQRSFTMSNGPELPGHTEEVCQYRSSTWTSAADAAGQTPSGSDGCRLLDMPDRYPNITSITGPMRCTTGRQFHRRRRKRSSTVRDFLTEGFLTTSLPSLMCPVLPHFGGKSVPVVSKNVPATVAKVYRPMSKNVPPLLYQDGY